MTHVTYRLTAKNRISSGTLRSVTEYELPLPYFLLAMSVNTMNTEYFHVEN